MSGAPRRNWQTSAAIGGLAFLAGATATHLGPVSRAIQRLDWTTVLESVVGAGIPLAVTAAVGVLIGRRMSKNAALDLHDAVEDLNDEREQKRSVARANERHARMMAWDRVHAVCELLLVPGMSDRGSYAYDVGQVAMQRSMEERAAGVKKRADSVDSQLACSRAWYQCEWGERLKAHIFELHESVALLRAKHDVEAMYVVETAIEALQHFADSNDWRSRDTESFVEASRDRQLITVSWDDGLSNESHDCVGVLATVARRQRTAPHEADELDVQVRRGYGEGRTYSVDVLALFRALEDRLECRPGEPAY